jgi:class 3 adenylate cyclase/tetratricopeptide (TPR) repeat protein
LDVAGWLRELGLEHYAQAFLDNDIAPAVLPELTDQDLKGLGVSLGHRRLLLKAIKELSDGPAGPIFAAPEPAQRSEAERRQLTVMFVDLVGSTTLSAQLDPEDMREVIRAYQNAVAGEIARFDGHVAKFMGDGVLAYFGWPRAHEDDAERAVRAGLEVVRAMAGIASPHGQLLAVRIGIATGLVVVGDLIGEGAAQEQAVVGDTPNLAARLQALATPGQVVIAEATRRLLDAGFDLEDLGGRPLKGIADPVAAFAVAGEQPTASRFEAKSGPALLPMVGRDQELALLLERWTQAKAGEGQGVLLVAEAGIGKSRLTRAMLDALADEPHTRIRYQCSPYHADSALWPVIQQLTRAAGIATDDPSDARLDKLEALLARAGNAAAPLIASLIGLDGGSRYGPLNVTPQAQRARTLDALVAQMLALARQQPVLVVLEDAHWVDPTTLEVMAQCLDRIADARVLILLTSRPDQQPDLAAHPHVTRLTLNRLGRAGAAAIVTRLSLGKALPAPVIDAIIARTDGVPLFVEELTKAILETGETTIPASLHDSLMARLDCIPEVKKVAQMAACIGREFDFALLAAVADLAEPDLIAALDRLASAELIFRRGNPPAARYTFKHALVQDTAYQSLLKSRRQKLHALIAEVLEERLTEAGEAGPEVLARHLTDAGLAARAIPYWRRAGELAAERSANVEAIAHLSKGLELIATPPNASNHLEEELALRMAIGGPLMATKGFAAPEVERTYSRASALCDQLKRSAELFPALRGLWNCYFIRGELKRAYDLAERLVALAEEEGAPLRRALSRRALGSTLFFLGRFADAAATLDQGVALDDAVAAWEDPSHLLLYAERAGVVSRLYSGWTLWFLGFPDRALQTVETGLALSQRLAHTSTIGFAHNYVATLHNLRGEFDAGRRHAEATIDLGREQPLPQCLADASICRGFALVGMGQQIEGIVELGAGLAAWDVIGARLQGTQFLGFLAEAHLGLGQFDDALVALDRAAETSAATGECLYQAELYRLRGSVLAETGENAAATVWLLRAIDTARSQQAKSLELRAATSLARLWAEQGDRQKAHDLLAPAYGLFTEGFETGDLKAAKALLDELR